MSRQSIRMLFAVSALILCALWSTGVRAENSRCNPQPGCCGSASVKGDLLEYESQERLSEINGEHLGIVLATVCAANY